MSCRTMPYLSGNNTVQSPNQIVEIFSPWWQGISGGGPFRQYRTKAKLSAYRGPNPSSASKHRMTPKEALEPLASYLDNDHLIPPPLSFSHPFLFQCGHQRVTRTPDWNLASISIPLIVPLQMLASVILFYLLVYIAILMFFSEAVSGGWWNCWFYALCLL